MHGKNHSFRHNTGIGPTLPPVHAVSHFRLLAPGDNLSANSFR